MKRQRESSQFIAIHEKNLAKELESLQEDWIIAETQVVGSKLVVHIYSQEEHEKEKDKLKAMTQVFNQLDNAMNKQQKERRTFIQLLEDLKKKKL